MSNYIKRTRHPVSGKWEDATWHDDYFGKHHYGVSFPSNPDAYYDPELLEVRDAPTPHKKPECSCPGLACFKPDCPAKPPEEEKCLETGGPHCTGHAGDKCCDCGRIIKKVAPATPTSSSWEEELEKNSAVRVLKRAEDFNPHQYKFMLRIFESFLSSHGESEYRRGGEEALAGILPRDNKCGSCGSGKVFVRGRFPGNDNRLVCPTCMREALDEIGNRASEHYGQASQLKQNPHDQD